MEQLTELMQRHGPTGAIDILLESSSDTPVPSCSSTPSPASCLEELLRTHVSRVLDVNRDSASREELWQRAFQFYKAAKVKPRKLSVVECGV